MNNPGFKKGRYRTGASIVLLVLAVLLQLCVAPLRVSASERNSAIADSRYGVVRAIRVGQDGYWTGTAFCIHVDEKGRCIFLTNHHVVWDNNTGAVGEIFIGLSNDTDSEEWMAECEVLYYDDDEDPDLAVIRTKSPVKGISPLPLLPTENVDAGEEVYALGFPGVVDDEFLMQVEDVTVTKGIISRYTQLTFKPDSNLIQHDAKINGGNSGGPLITVQGAVIGINTYSVGMTIDAQNGESISEYSYAVVIDHAIEVLEDLDIPYELYQESSGKGMVYAGAAAVLAGILLAVFLIWKKKPFRSSAYVLAAEGGILGGNTWTIHKNGILIGRDPTQCKICFPAETKGVSRCHARLIAKDNGVELTDLNSSYGTFTEAGPVFAQSPVILKRGAKFWLGEKDNLFRLR